MASDQWPRRWLMTDERIGPALLGVVEALPGGVGVVLRHHSLGDAEREALGRAIAAICRHRGLLLSVSRDAGLAKRLDAAMVHNPPAGEVALPFSLSVHDEVEAERARSSGAALAFVSPVHSTRSHVGAVALGEERAIALAAISGCPAIALGGMNEQRFARLAEHGFAGWAGIDAWIKR